MSQDRVFVIIQRLSPVGGIETLVLRLLPHLHSDRSPVVIFGSAKDDEIALPSGVNFISVKDEHSVIASVSKYCHLNYPDRALVLITLHPWSLLYAFVIRYAMRLKGRHVIHSFHLVTHSRAMFFSGPKVVKFVLKEIFFRAPPASTYFMNIAARDAHELEWHTPLHQYPILRLPVDDRVFAKPETTPHGLSFLKGMPGLLHIVSVGRLVEFKAYNRGAPSIVRQLRDEGIDVLWEIWGDGDDYEQIRATIDRLELNKSIRLMGTLPYNEFDQVVGIADVFIGMGTALLEAAQLSVPSICAIETSSNESYGFLNEAPLDSLGDIVYRKPRSLIIENIRRFYYLNPHERADLGFSSFESFKNRSINISQFSEKIRQADPWPVDDKISSFLLMCVSRIFSKLRGRRVRKMKS